MAWVNVAMIGGAALGAYQGNENRKAQADQNKMNAEISAAQAQYSPWTNIKPQGVNATPVTASALGGAEQGLLTGAMYSNAIKGANQKADMGELENDLNAPPAQDASGMPMDMSAAYKKKNMRPGY